MDFNQVNIPQKGLYRFNEVTSLTGIKPYVLRFWETEFEQIAPQISHDGQKVYEKRDVETVMEIKRLLFEHKLSIPKAKQLLSKKVIAAAKEVEAPRIIEEETHSHHNEIIVDEDNLPRLTSGDLQKLSSAKTNLRNALAFINIIKKKKNW
jgi:DNA-binding transcriptional MerR regulator